MNNPHDHAYKLLFGDSCVVRDLMIGFIDEDWIQRLDFDSLEKVSGTFVSDDLRDRESDVIWRVRFDDEWLYVYLLLEFQSTVDAFMALRIMTYTGLLYQDLVKQKILTHADKLPPVLPVVLYNGKTRWNAPLNVSELVQPVPGDLDRYRPAQPYLLLDQGAIVASERFSMETRNLVSAIFRLEHHRSPEEAVDTIRRLVEWLQAPEQTGLRQHFAMWINRVLVPNWVPEDELTKWQALTDLNEVHNMMAERARLWLEQWKQKGLEEGRQEGRQEGLLEAARNLIRDTPLTDEVIAHATGLDIVRVAELREEIRH